MPAEFQIIVGELYGRCEDLAERRMKRHARNPNAHFANTYTRHFHGALGEAGVELWAREVGIPHFAHFWRDDRPADLDLAEDPWDVKSRYATYWEEAGTSIPDSQFAKLAKEVKGILFCTVERNRRRAFVHVRGYAPIRAYAELLPVRRTVGSYTLKSRFLPHDRIQPLERLVEWYCLKR